MDLIVTAPMGERAGCAPRRSQLRLRARPRRPVADKREGDGGTPAGRFPFRRLLYRADRVARIETRLPARHIERDDGWCDDPASPDYNKPVRLPHPARHENMWLETPLYDLVVVIGHNDDPGGAGRRQRRFLHVARDDWGPTAGCIAFKREDLLAILAQVCARDASSNSNSVAALCPFFRYGRHPGHITAPALTLSVAADACLGRGSCGTLAPMASERGSETRIRGRLAGPAALAALALIATSALSRPARGRSRSAAT